MRAFKAAAKCYSREGKPARRYVLSLVLALGLLAGGGNARAQSAPAVLDAPAGADIVVSHGQVTVNGTPFSLGSANTLNINSSGSISIVSDGSVPIENLSIAGSISIIPPNGQPNGPNGPVVPNPTAGGNIQIGAGQLILNSACPTGSGGTACTATLSSQGGTVTLLTSGIQLTGTPVVVGGVTTLAGAKLSVSGSPITISATAAALETTLSAPVEARPRVMAQLSGVPAARMANGSQQAVRRLATDVQARLAGFLGTAGTPSGQPLAAFSSPSLLLAQLAEAKLLQPMAGNARFHAGAQGDDGAPTDAGGLWVGGGGERSRLRGDTALGASGLHTATDSAVIGADRQITQDWRAGIAFSRDQASLRLDDASATGGSRGNQVSIYGAYNLPDSGWVIRAYGQYGQFDNHLNRGISGSAASPSGSFKSRNRAIYLEAGRGFALADSSRLEPFAGLRWSRSTQDAYTETGGGPFNLAYRALEREGADSTVGVRYFGQLRLSSGRDLSFGFDGDWTHRFGDNRQVVTASFADFPGSVFSNPGGRLDRDAYRLSAYGSWPVSPAASVFVQAAGEAGNSLHSTALVLGLRRSWR